MKIGALVPWFGGKRTLAPAVVRLLGPHRCYWEPFCGSMAVLLAKPAAAYESVNDLHGDLVNLARVLQLRETAEALHDRAYRTLFAEDLCKEGKEVLARPWEPDGRPDIDRAYWYLVFSWFHLNGLAGTRLNQKGSFCVRYSSKGGNGAVRWRGVVDSIPDWHERLLRVQITCRDGLGLLAGIEDREGTVVYADPPYLKEGGRYVHSFSPSQHEELARQLRRFLRTRVVVSYYDDPRLAGLYPGWEKIEPASLNVAKSMVKCGMRDRSGRITAPEVLLVNRPAAAQPGLFAGDANANCRL